MGNKRKIGGALKVRDAQRLFEQTGDYQYVALAIGASINNPPKWALIECWRFRKISEADPALATNLPKASRILNRAVELMIEHEGRQWDVQRALQSAKNTTSLVDFEVKPLPLETALKKALSEIDPSRDQQSAIESLKKAWQREQREELIDEASAGDYVEGYRTTYRIRRVSNRVTANEFNAADPSGPWVENPDDLIFWDKLTNGMS